MLADTTTSIPHVRVNHLPCFPPQISARSDPASALANEGSAAYVTYLEGWETNSGRLAAALTSLGLTPAIGSDASTVDEREVTRVVRRNERRRRRRRRRVELAEQRGGDSSMSDSSSDSEDDESSGGMSDGETLTDGRFENGDGARSEAAEEVPLMSDGQFAILNTSLHTYSPSSSNCTHPNTPRNDDSQDSVFSASPSAVAQLPHLSAPATQHSVSSRPSALSPSEPTTASLGCWSEPPPNLSLLKVNSTSQRQQQQHAHQQSSLDSSTVECRMSSPGQSPSAILNRMPPLKAVRDKEERRQWGYQLEDRHGRVVLPFKCVPFVHSMPVSGVSTANFPEPSKGP